MIERSVGLRRAPGRRSLVTLLVAGLLLTTPGLAGAGTAFVRGDADGDGSVSGIIDSVYILNYLFGQQAVPCLDAADVNDDGSVDIVDPVRLLHWTFAGSGNPPMLPFPACGADPTADTLDCADFPSCP